MKIFVIFFLDKFAVPKKLVKMKYETEYWKPTILKIVVLFKYTCTGNGNMFDSVI